MFRLDRNVMRVLFTLDDRDLALALVDVEGLEVCEFGGAKRAGAEPGPPLFFRFCHVRGQSLIEPEQVTPGVFSYRVRKRAKVS